MRGTFRFRKTSTDEGDCLLVKLFLDGHEQSLNGISDKEYQQDGHPSGAVVVTLKRVGNHIANASGAYHAQNGALRKIGLQAHARPGHNLRKGRRQNGIAEDAQAAGTGDLQCLDGLLRDALKALGKRFGEKGGGMDAKIATPAPSARDLSTTFTH